MNLRIAGLFSRIAILAFAGGNLIWNIMIWVQSLPSGKILLDTNSLGEARGEIAAMLVMLFGVGLLVLEYFIMFKKEVIENETSKEMATDTNGM